MRRERQRALVVRDAREVAPAQVLHHDVRLPVLGAAEVEDRDRVRVAEATRRARLVQEARRAASSSSARCGWTTFTATVRPSATCSAQ